MSGQQVSSKNYEVLKGYKQTEVGAIPEDWELKTIGEIGFVTSGGTPSRTNLLYWGGDIPWITTTQIDFNVITTSEQFITEAGLKNSAAKLFSSGTLLMAMYGQGKTRGKVAILGLEASTNQACAAISINDSVEKSYVFHYLISQYETIRNLSNTGNQENLNGLIIKSIKIPLPLKEEQRAIAQALSNVDALIAGLDKLIAKKRHIKTATMQQLLTGKKRLPGFGEGKGYKKTDLGVIPEDWDYFSLENFITEFRGGAPLKPSDFKNSGVKVLPKVGVVRGGVLKIYEKDLQFCSEKYADKYSKNKVNDTYTIVVLRDLVPSGPSIGLIVQIAKPENYLLAQGVYGFKTTGIVSNYLIQYSNSFPYRKLMNEIMVGSTQVHITNTAFKAVKLPFPKLEEQQAIAQVLSDMDGEITGLEKRRAKTQAIKQGMMQELLTGRTRLSFNKA